MGTLANSADPDEKQNNSKEPDEMQHNAFHQSLHGLLGFKQHSGTEMHHNLDKSTCGPLKYTMGSPIFMVSICMGKSIRIQRVNSLPYWNQRACH